MAREAPLDTLRAVLARRAERVTCAYLFGSAARAQARAGSDLDIAVLLREPPPATVEGLAFEIGGEIERATGTPVDIVVLNRASPDLVHRVLRDGVLVHESDPRARVAFETRKRAAGPVGDQEGG
jgi:predicted nucleotidyltransferase